MDLSNARLVLRKVVKEVSRSNDIIVMMKVQDILETNNLGKVSEVTGLESNIRDFEDKLEKEMR